MQVVVVDGNLLQSLHVTNIVWDMGDVIHTEAQMLQGSAVGQLFGNVCDVVVRSAEADQRGHSSNTSRQPNESIVVHIEVSTRQHVVKIFRKNLRRLQPKSTRGSRFRAPKVIGNEVRWLFAKEIEVKLGNRPICSGREVILFLSKFNSLK
jgi:hypothetical protein